jgi:hypothetical protein
VHIARREHRHDFTDADASALAAVTAAIAAGIRTSLRFDAARPAHDGTAPGLVVLGAGDDVELMTPPADALLDAMRSSVLADQTPPTALLALAAFARSRRPGAGQEPDVVAVPTASRWITLHASLPEALRRSGGDRPRTRGHSPEHRAAPRGLRRNRA